MLTPEIFSQPKCNTEALEHLTQRYLEELGINISLKHIELPAAYGQLSINKESVPYHLSVSPLCSHEQLALGYFHCLAHIAIGHNFRDDVETQEPTIHFEKNNNTALRLNLRLQEAGANYWTQRFIDTCIAGDDTTIHQTLADFVEAIKEPYAKGEIRPFYAHSMKEFMTGFGVLHDFFFQARKYFD